ncbi:MAG: lipocalin family protein [Saprospirales bacterium]|nr:lipocalin family protein [Saprospirales bacterium]MBK8492418.1 lipocalin family protein [Saprospirales bacterium]
MPIKTIPLFFFIFMLLWSACSNPAETALVGRWQGVELTEEGEQLNLDPGEIRFEFLAKKGYIFSSTLKYREAGTFRVQTEYLITQDTSHAGATDKSVRIVQLEADTLVLEMKDQEKTRLLKLLRTPQ